LKGALLGDLLIFGAVFSAAFYIVGARNLGKKYSSKDITTMQTLYGAIFFAPAFFWELPEVKWSAMNGRSLAALIYLTVFATVAAFLCYNHALTKIPAARASVFINGIPVVTAVGAWLLLGETLNPTQSAGGLLVLTAVFVTSYPDLKEAREKAREAKRRN
jgi:drug/metabolite transporter (DMT)-like permease